MKLLQEVIASFTLSNPREEIQSGRRVLPSRLMCDTRLGIQRVLEANRIQKGSLELLSSSSTVDGSLRCITLNRIRVNASEYNIYGIGCYFVTMNGRLCFLFTAWNGA